MAFNITAIMNVALASGAATKISNDLNKQLGNKKVNIDLNMANADSIKRIKADIEGAITSVESFGRQAGLAAKRFGAFSLAAGSMISLSNAIRKGTEEAIDFDRQMVKLVQVSGDTGSAIQGVVDEVTRLSTSLGVSSKDLIQAAVTLKQANLSIADTRIALEALAKAALAPNFENFTNTTEGAIAILNQFKIGASNLEGALGAVNAVAGEFAVEAGDIVEAIRKTGGAFKAAGGDLNELLGLFTSVRQTTRESAETISTGLRTIFTRIQRGNTVNALKEVGVQLRYTREEALALGNANLEQQFVGPYEAIRRLSAALSGLPTTDPKFAQIVEELGGYRQISKVIPLIQEFAVSQKAVNVAIAGAGSLTQNAGQAQLAYAVKLQKLKEEFNALIRSITQSTGFQKLFDTFISGASAAIQLADALKPLIPLVGALAAVKVATGIGQFVKGFSTGITASPNPKIFNQNRFADGGVVKMKRGGVVPGTGSGDIVPALLEPGEVVIPKRFAAGGVINLEDYQSGKKSPNLRNVIQVTLLKPGEGVKSPKATVKDGRIQSDSAIKAYVYGQEISIKDTDIPVFTYNPGIGDSKLSEKIKNEATNLINESKDIVNRKKINDRYGKTRGPEIVKGIINSDTNGQNQLEGYIFEYYYNKRTKSKEASTEANFPIDSFSTSENLSKFIKDENGKPNQEAINKILGNKKSVYVELKRSVVSAADIINKESRVYAKDIANIAKVNRPADFEKNSDIITFPKKRKKADGGFIVPGVGNSDSVPMDLEEGSFVIRKSSVSKIGADNLSNMARKGFASGGRVPSLLTPGEFVFSPSSASSIGSSNLDRMNKFGKFALGGRVGFAAGGDIDPRLLITAQQQGQIFKNRKFDLSTLVSAQTGSEEDQYSAATKILTDIIYEQIRAKRVDISASQAMSAAQGIATSTMRKYEKLNEKILTTTSAVATARTSSTFADPNLDPAVITAEKRLEELKTQRTNLASTLEAQALPTGEQVYRFLPAEKAPLNVGEGRRGSESLANILSTRTEERLGKIAPSREAQQAIGTYTQQRLLTEEENKFKQQAVLAIANQLKIITGINDKEILIEAATQKYAQAVQQNANFVEKQGRVFGLESLEQDVIQKMNTSGKKVSDDLRGISTDLTQGKGFFGRFRVSFNSAAESIKSAFANLRDEIRNAGGGLRGTFAGFQRSSLGRGIIGAASVAASFGANYLENAAGTAEDVSAGRTSRTTNIIGSGISAGLGAAATAAIAVNVIPGLGQLASGLIIAGAGIASFISASKKAAAEIEKLNFQKSADKVNDSLRDVAEAGRFTARSEADLIRVLADFKVLQSRAREQAKAEGGDVNKIVADKLSERFGAALQPLTQILLSRVEQRTVGGEFNAEKIFADLKKDVAFFEILGAASRKSGDELNKFAFNLVKGKIESDRLAEVQRNAVASVEKLALSLEFFGNAVALSVQDFENMSRATTNFVDAMDRRSEFRAPVISERLKIGTPGNLFGSALDQTFGILGDAGKEQKNNALNLNKLYTALPAALQVARDKDFGTIAGEGMFKELQAILKEQKIDLKAPEFSGFAANIEDLLEKSRQSLTRQSKDFDPFALTKKALDQYANQFNQTNQQLANAVNSVGQEYINGLKRISDEQNRYLNELVVLNEKSLNVKKIEAEIQSAQTGRPISDFLKTEDINQPLLIRQRQLLENTNVNKADILDPQAIFKDLMVARDELKKSDEELKGSFTDLANADENARKKAQELALANQNIRDRISNLSDALKNLRDETISMTEAQGRLADAEQQREAKLSAARSMFTMDKRQLKELERGRGIAQDVAAGADISGLSLKRRKEFVQFTETFKNVRLPEFGGKTGEQIQNLALKRAYPQLNIQTEEEKSNQARADMLAIAKRQEEAAKLYSDAIKNGQDSTKRMQEIADKFIKDLKETFSVEQRKPLEAQRASLENQIGIIAGKDKGKDFADIRAGENLTAVKNLEDVYKELGLSNKDAFNVQADRMSETEQGYFASLFKRGPNLQTALNAQSGAKNLLEVKEFDKESIKKAGFKDGGVIDALNKLQSSLISSKYDKDLRITNRYFDKNLFEKALADIRDFGNIQNRTKEEFKSPEQIRALENLQSSLGLQNIPDRIRQSILREARKSGFGDSDQMESVINDLEKLKDIKIPFGRIGQELINLVNQLEEINKKIKKITIQPEEKAFGGLVSYFSEGGLAKGKDNIAMIANDEFIVNANATRNNLPLLNAINSGVNYKAEGGIQLRPKKAERNDPRIDPLIRSMGGVENEVAFYIDKGKKTTSESKTPYNIKRINPELYKDFEFKAYLNRITSKDVELKNSVRYGLIDFRDEFERSVSDYLSANEVFNNKDLLNEYMMELYVRASEKFDNLPSAKNINDVFNGLSNSEKNNILKIDSFAPRYPFSSTKVNLNDLNKDAAYLWLMNRRRVNRWQAEMMNLSPRDKNASGFLADIQADNFNNDPNKEAKALIEQTLKYREFFKNKQQQVFNEILTGTTTYAENEIAFHNDPNATRQMPLMNIPLARARENENLAFQKKQLKPKVQFARKDKDGNFHLDENARTGNTPSVIKREYIEKDKNGKIVIDENGKPKKFTGRTTNIGPIYDQSFSDLGELTAVEVDPKTGRIEEVDRSQFVIPSRAKVEAQRKEIEEKRARRIADQEARNDAEKIVEDRAKLSTKISQIAKDPSADNLNTLSQRFHVELAKTIASVKKKGSDIDDPRIYAEFDKFDLNEKSIDEYKKEGIDSIIPSLGVLRKYYQFRNALRFKDPNDPLTSFQGRDKLASELTAEATNLIAMRVLNKAELAKPEAVKKDGAMPVGEELVSKELEKLIRNYRQYYSFSDALSKGEDPLKKGFKNTDYTINDYELKNLRNDLPIPFSQIGLNDFMSDNGLDENNPEYIRLTKLKDKLFPYYEKSYKLVGDYSNIYKHADKVSYARPYFDATKKDADELISQMNSEINNFIRSEVVKNFRKNQANAAQVQIKPKPVVEDKLQAPQQLITPSVPPEPFKLKIPPELAKEKANAAAIQQEKPKVDEVFEWKAPQNSQEMYDKIYELKEAWIQSKEHKEFLAERHNGVSGIDVLNELEQKDLVSKERLRLRSYLKYLDDNGFREKFRNNLLLRNGGGMIPTMLTPGEAVIPPQIAKNNLSLLNDINYRKGGGGVNIVKSSGKSHPLSRGTDTEFQYLEAGSYVVNRASTEKNMGLLKSLSAGGVVYRQGGGLLAQAFQAREDQNILNSPFHPLFRAYTLREQYANDPTIGRDLAYSLPIGFYEREAKNKELDKNKRLTRDQFQLLIEGGKKFLEQEQSKEQQDRLNALFSGKAPSQQRMTNEEVGDQLTREWIANQARKQQQLTEQSQKPPFGNRGKGLEKNQFDLLNDAFKKLEKEQAKKEEEEDIKRRLGAGFRANGGLIYRAEGGDVAAGFSFNPLESGLNIAGLTAVAANKFKEKKDRLEETDIYSWSFDNLRIVKSEQFNTEFDIFKDYIDAIQANNVKDEKAMERFNVVKQEKDRRSQFRPQLIDREVDIFKLMLRLPTNDNNKLDLGMAKDFETTPEEARKNIEKARDIQRLVNAEKRYTGIVSGLVSLDRFGKRNKGDSFKEAEKYFDLAEIKAFADEKNKPAALKDRKDIDPSYFKDIVGIKGNVVIPEKIKAWIINYMKNRKIKGFYGSDDFQRVTGFDDTVFNKIGTQTIFLRRSDVDSIQEAAGRENKNRLNIIGDITDKQISGDFIRGKGFMPDLTPDEMANALPGSDIAFQAAGQAEEQGLGFNQRFFLNSLDPANKPKGFAFGGYVNGASYGDMIPARLRAGEFVLNPQAAQSIGYGNLNAINEQRFFDGGIAGGDRLFDKVTKSSSAQKLDQIDTKSFSDSVKMFDGGVNKFDSSIKSMGESITRLQSAINDLAKINIPEEINGNITVENNANIKIDSPNFAGEVNTVVSNTMSKIVKALESTTGGAISQADIFRDIGTA